MNSTTLNWSATTLQLRLPRLAVLSTLLLALLVGCGQAGTPRDEPVVVDVVDVDTDAAVQVDTVDALDAADVPDAANDGPGSDGSDSLEAEDAPSPDGSDASGDVAVVDQTDAVGTTDVSDTADTPIAGSDASSDAQSDAKDVGAVSGDTDIGAGQDAADSAAQTDAVGDAADGVATNQDADTPDTADPSPSCVGKAQGADCDDGDPCTEAECVGGVCTVQADLCACQTTADCADDADLCNGKPYCDKSSLPYACKANPATVVTCQPTSLPCQTAVCEPATGVCSTQAVSDNIPCTDGDTCTVGDYCSSGTCKSGTDTCCSSDADCTKQDDGDLCNGTLFCNKSTGECLFNPATVVICPTVDNTACQTAVCDPKQGVCELSFAVTGTQCDDGNPCTPNELCTDGKCQTETNLCECKLDADCDTKEDGNKCNGTLYCDIAQSECKLNPASVVYCAPGLNACAPMACEPSSGACVSKPLPANTLCDDGDPCTAVGTCVAGACENGIDLCPCELDEECEGFEDGDLCNGTLYCDKASGVCLVNPASKTPPCPTVDDTDCVTNRCQPKTGKCTLLPAKVGTPCDDGQNCTKLDECTAGDCVGLASNCNDGNPCTEDACSKDGSCFNNPTSAPCNDGNACTVGDTCKLTNCVAGLATVCDDANPCTTETCVPATGKCNTIYNASPCTDLSVCTEGDICKDGTCLAGAAKLCVDGLECTVDNCDPAAGCKFTPTPGFACNDGLACTTPDKCDGAVCKGSIKFCDDNNVCTDDSCAPATGDCVFLANSATCTDDSVCTVGDKCLGKGCVSGSEKSCNDNDVCTSDSCNPLSDCKHLPLSQGVCNDNVACTENDLCVSGKCTGTTKSCDDNDACTNDSCEPSSGTCTHSATAVALACSDGNVCTTDSCAPATGLCVYLAIIDGCNDGNACTADSCVPSSGCSYAAVNCDDDNLCTNDSCNPETGCIKTNNILPCDDLSACSKDDTCSNGVCAGLALYPAPFTAVTPNHDYFREAVALADGSVAVVGATGANNTDALLTIVPHHGATAAFSTTMGGSDADNLSSVLLDGSVLVATGSCDQAGSASNACFLRVHANSTTILTKTVVDGGGAEYANRIIGAGSDYALIGTRVVGGNSDLWLCLVGTAGNKLQGCSSGFSHSGSTYDGGYDAVRLSDGSFVVVGFAGPTPDGSAHDGAIWRISSTGTELWHQVVAGNNGGGDNLQRLVQLADGTLVAAGYNGSQGWLYAFGPDGEFRWQANLPGLTTLTDINVVAGGFVVVGDTVSGSALVGTDTVGNALWQRPLAALTKHGFAAAPTTSGFAVVGNAKTVSADPGDAVLVWTDPWGFANCQDAGLCTGLTECIDSVVCTDSFCDASVGCKHTPAVNGQPCDDGKACTVADKCGGAACAGEAKPCDDNDACTNDSCDPSTGTCTHGTTAVALACSDGNVCTTDSCSPATGSCVYQPIVGGCDDGDACTTDSCLPGSGCSYATLNCEDGNVCTTDSCVPSSGCVKTNNTVPCDDLSACTSGDVCAEGTCAGASPYGSPYVFSTAGYDYFKQAVALPDGSVAVVGTNGSDGVLSLVPAQGSSSTFSTTIGGTDNDLLTSAIVDGDVVVATGNCDIATNAANACLLRVNSSTKKVLTSKVIDGGAAEYGDRVVKNGINYMVIGSRYVGTNPDMWLCMVDSAGNKIQGCNSGFATNANTEDRGYDGVALSDGSIIVVGYVAPSIGANGDATIWRIAADGTKLWQQTIPGDAGGDDVFTRVVRLPDGSLVAGGYNGSQAQLYAFTEAGSFKWQANIPNQNWVDSLHVTDAGYVLIGKSPTGPAMVGTDPVGVPLWTRPLGSLTKAGFGAAEIPGGFAIAGTALTGTADVGDAVLMWTDTWGFSTCAAANKCGGVTDCGDAAPCTDDFCSASVGCVHTNAVNGQPCEDGVACTILDNCIGAECKGVAKPCDDNDACTNDSCEPSTGTCTHSATAAALACSDGNVCTTDSCAPATGLCVYLAIVGGCNDGDACTTDSCVPSGGCSYTTVNCDDGNVCTTDGCVPASGCVKTNNILPCDDLSACTTGDVCAEGSCAGVSPYGAPYVFTTAGSDDFRDAALLPDGSVAVVGTSGANGSDGLLAIVPALGSSSTFSTTIGGPNFDNLVHAIVDGNVIAATGTCESGGSKNACLLRVNSTTKAILTSTTIDGGGTEFGNRIVQNGNNYTLIGSTNANMWLCTVNAAGTPLQGFNTGFAAGTSGMGDGHDGVRLSDGSFIVIGRTIVSGTNRNGVIWRISPTGVKVWDQIIPGSVGGGDEFFRVIQIADGSLVAAGHNATQGLLYAFTEQGQFKWKASVPSLKDISSLHAVSEGFLLFGETLSGGAIVGTDSIGNTVWSRPLATLSQRALGATPRPGGLAIVGAKLTGTSDAGDAALMWTDPWGFSDCTTSGKCAGLTTCTDNLPCTADTCAPENGCAHSQAGNGLPCDDGAACTVADGCTGGTCAAGMPKLWAKQLNFGTATDQGAPVVVTSDGGAVIAINSDGGGTILGTDASGTTRFTTQFPGSDMDLRSMVALPSGGYVAGGSIGWPTYLNYAVAIDENGKSLWAKTIPYSNENTSDFGGMALSAVGKVLVAGSVTIPSTARRGRIAELNNDGTVFSGHDWLIASPDGADNAGFSAIAQDTSGGYWAVGSRYRASDNDKDAWLVRIDASGAITVNTTFGTSGKADGFNNIVADSTGATVLGTTTSIGAGSYDIWLVRVDNAGTKLWEKTFGGPGTDDGLVLAKLTDDSLVLAGRMDVAGVANTFLARVNDSGNTIWQKSGTLTSGGTYWRGMGVSATTIVASGMTNVSAIGSSDTIVATFDVYGNATCANSGNCAAKDASDCDDGNPCTLDSCTAGGCTNAPSAQTEGSTCGGDGSCFLGTCCPNGTVGTSVDGSPVCAPDYPVWGARPVNPIGVYTNNGDGTVSDSQTKLRWQRTTTGTYTWDAAVAYCDSLSLANQSDWRLPTVAEAESLLDYTVAQPNIDSTTFPNADLGSHWTAVPYKADSTRYWSVPLYCAPNVASCIVDRPKTATGPVRCVRTEETITPPAARFALAGGGAGTTLDNATGLVWQHGVAVNKPAYDQDYCATLAANNYWRNPTIRELFALVDRTQDSPATTPGYFPDMVGTEFWSATKRNGGSGNSDYWMVHFDHGGSDTAPMTILLSVRCVHGP